MKLNILLINDNDKTRSHIEELLKTIKNEGELFFSKNGTDALAKLDNTNLNIVISDIQSPQVDGKEFLDVIKNKYPSLIRVVLFEQENQMDLLLKSIASAHKYISKPVELEQFRTILTEANQLYNLLDNENLRAIINRIDKFPLLPQTYIDIEDELNKEHFSLQRISEIVHSDIFISTRILQVVNSPFFCLPRNVTDIKQAVNLLGITMIKSLILYVQIFNSYEGNMRVENLHKEIWNHSLKVANNAKLLSSNLGDKKDIETAYIAGLLHDIGKIIIINTEDFIYEILELMKLENIEYNDAEKKLLGTTHSEIGAYLLSLWGLPKVIIESVLHHHNIHQTNTEKLDIKTLVYLANACAEETQMNPDFLAENGFEKISSEVFALCG